MVIDVRIKKINRAAAFTICIVTFVLMMFSGIRTDVHAEDTGSVTLVCEKNDETIAGMSWKMYYIGDRYGDRVAFVGAFANYKVTLRDLSAESLTSAASTLESYARLDKIKPDREGITDGDGKVKFTDLKRGIYLVSGDRLTIGKDTYVPAPTIVEVSESNPDITAYPKFTFYDVLGAVTDRFRVRKIWENDEEHMELRPTSIDVSIYCNYELKETVTLSEENRWTYSWTGNTGDIWTVIEPDIPEKYTVVYRANEAQFVVVNTYDDIPPIVTTTTTATGTTDITNTTAITTTSATNTTASDDVLGTEKVRTKQKTTAKKTESKLPQTGQLWWPVPILALGGMIFLGIGCRLISKSKKEDD